MSAKGDDSGVSLKRRGEIKFAKPFVRALIRDGRLSFAARGLFVFLWDLPSGWEPNIRHLIKMSGAGRDALMRLRRELEQVGGVEVEAIRLTSEQAADRNAVDPERRHPYRAGQVVGSRWVLVAPDLWAIEMPLNEKAGRQKDREPEKPALGNNESRSHPPSENPTTRFTDSDGSASLEGLAMEGKQQQSANAPPAAARTFKTECERHSVRVWRQNGQVGGDDDKKVDVLLAEFGAEAVESVGKSLAEKDSDGNLPLPSTVAKELRRRAAAAARELRQTKYRAESAAHTPPASLAKRKPALDLARSMVRASISG